VGSDGAVRGVLRQYWGFETLRPLQAEAIEAGLARRDSLVVMPTGGGKSLCFQAPAVLSDGLTIVVSPLIALMQDQVEGLRLAGYPAGALHSNVREDEARGVRERVRDGTLKLLYVSPERLLGAGFLAWVGRLHDARKLAGFAIDEAHCISQWGHDFRPEYRRLTELRRAFPGAPFHAFTATATPRVREDIIAQLALREARVLVGKFDRPNLTYRVVPRGDAVSQARGVLRRHEGRAAIVYCISRKDTEQFAEDLRALGVDAKAYHAGMDARTREKVQRAFLEERLNVVVATVAFGMGIDRGDVRCVIHAAMPKSVEHYQQETGRAGRDGLASECVLLHSPQDVVRWNRLMLRSARESDADGAQVEAGLRVQRELLRGIQGLCGSARCRHRALSEYFGQEYEGGGGGGGCGACDVCLGEVARVEGAGVIAQKILSCVYRVGQGYGAAHVADVLRGSRAAKILALGHDRLSTFGLLASTPREAILRYTQQLLDQGLLAQTQDEYPVLMLSAESAGVLKGAREVELFDPVGERGAAKRTTAPAATSGAQLTEEERGLFESLRGLRRQLAEGMGVPPYVVFSDVTLEELARVRPSSAEVLRGVRGIGSVKLGQFGGAFVAHIAEYSAGRGLALDAAPTTRGGGSREVIAIEPRATRVRPAAAERFARGESLEAVAGAIGLAVSTMCDQLVAWIEATRPESVEAWVDRETYARVERALDEVGGSRLRPVWEQLEGKVSYEAIKVTIAHLRAGG
jgi:ATP-dependent DNA helicase RecQ